MLQLAVIVITQGKVSSLEWTGDCFALTTFDYKRLMISTGGKIFREGAGGEHTLYGKVSGYCSMTLIMCDSITCSGFEASIILIKICVNNYLEVFVLLLFKCLSSFL